MWGAASSCTPCWFAPGTQGTRVSEQEGFDGGRVSEPGAGFCAQTLRRSCGKAQKPRCRKHLVKAHRGQRPRCSFCGCSVVLAWECWGQPGSQGQVERGLLRAT